MSRPRQSDRAFGLTFAIVFAIAFAIGWGAFDVVLAWAAVASVLCLALALASPEIFMPFNRLWCAIGRKLGIVNNYLVLGIFYGLVIVPVGLARRVFGRDPMTRRRDKSATSYFMPVSRNPDRDNFRDMF